MDRMLRAEIVATVRQTLQEVLEGADEVWLTSDQLLERFGMFSKDWLAHNGHLLPRERAEVITDGKPRGTRWAYPQHRIQRMIKERELCNLSHNRSQNHN